MGKNSLSTLVFVLTAIFSLVNCSSIINGTSGSTTLKCYNCTWINAGVKGQRGRGLTQDDLGDNPCTNSNTCVVDANKGVCVKEVIKEDGVIRSVKRFCAASSESGGCFEVHGQHATIMTTICLCNDWHKCNLATSIGPVSFLIITNMMYLVLHLLR